MIPESFEEISVFFDIRIYKAKMENKDEKEPQQLGQTHSPHEV